MPSNQCAALDCHRSIPSRFLMCQSHWYQVPQLLRGRVVVTWEEGLDVPYRIARWLAVKEVAIAEGKFHPDEAKFQAVLGEWQAVRAALRLQAGAEWESLVRPFRRRLEKLMHLCGAGCPIETAARAMEYDPRSGSHEGLRKAAAVDLYEGFLKGAA